MPGTLEKRAPKEASGLQLISGRIERSRTQISSVPGPPTGWSRGQTGDACSEGKCLVPAIQAILPGSCEAS